jgi:hypothetical protein
MKRHNGVYGIFILCLISLPVTIIGFVLQCPFCPDSYSRNGFTRIGRPRRARSPNAPPFSLERNDPAFGDALAASPLENMSNDPFLKAMMALGYSDAQRGQILAQLQAAGLWEDSQSSSSRMLFTVTQDFGEQTSAISTLLIQDFGLSPLVAHQTRAALQYTRNEAEKVSADRMKDHRRKTREVLEEKLQRYEAGLSMNDTAAPSSLRNRTSLEQRYKATIVSAAAQHRDQLSYSLSLDAFPVLQAELQDFFRFMTLPSTDAQGETPIRAATANIYLRHAKLFLGWYWDIHSSQQQQAKNKETLSLFTIFPSKEKDHAAPILEFIMWLRKSRCIAVSYEANLLRGLSKLLKWRFRKESCGDDHDGSTLSNASFGDIPVIRELRKLHRDANRRQAVAPRVSNEDHKWLSWPEYLQVVQSARTDLYTLLQAYENEFAVVPTVASKQLQRSQRVHQRQVAVVYQKYLILAVFANIPDRQRTIRELEIGRSFVKDVRTQQWCIKHAPEDYKTGKTYGERPALHLPTSLTNEIDTFIDEWRPVLLDKRNEKTKATVAECHHLFLSVRSGDPLTSDAVYHTVSKTCFAYSGKRTNPHLLRDMIVTHVRESSHASEQQLEALALFMGHSAAIQRKSYDRRTLSKKVAPAVALLEQVNAGGLGGSINER